MSKTPNIVTNQKYIPVKVHNHPNGFHREYIPVGQPASYDSSRWKAMEYKELEGGDILLIAESDAPLFNIDTNVCSLKGN